MLLIETSRGNGRGLLWGIARYAQLHGPWEFLHWPGGIWVSLPSYFKQCNCDGIIMRDPLIKEMIKIDKPTIIFPFFKMPDVDLPSVTIDSAAAGKLAAEYFLNLGFQHFAFAGCFAYYWNKKLKEGFNKRIKKAGFKVSFFERSPSNKDALKEQYRAVIWLKSLPKPIGLFAAADDDGRDILQACKGAGINVPEEIAILGVDNDKTICDLCHIPLSSIALNLEKAGYEVAELLDKMMAGKKIKNNTIVVRPTHVVTRQSTDILAIEDKEVAEAMRFIREHRKEVVQVNDVADAVAVSRRKLEMKFQKTLGRSVLKEIKRVRIELISRMLTETNQLLSKIAFDLGFSTPGNMTVYFRQETKMSPRDYRNKFRSK